MIKKALLSRRALCLSPHFTFANKKNTGILGKIRHAIKETIDGTKKTYRDYRFTNELLRDKTLYTENYTAWELRELKRIKSDALRLLPFSFFLLIPLLEALLPPYLLLFPNAFPSQYIPSGMKKQREELKLKKQEEAHKELMDQMKSCLIASQIDITRLLDLVSFRKLVIESSEFIEDELHLDKLDSDTLIMVSRFLCMNVVTGTHIVSQIFRFIINAPYTIANIFMFITRNPYRYRPEHWIFYHEFKMNYWFLENYKRKLLTTQIARHIRQLRAEDHAFAKFGFKDAKMPKDALVKFAHERGMCMRENQEVEEQFVDFWLPETVDVSVSDTMYLWLALMNYNREFKHEKL